MGLCLTWCFIYRIRGDRSEENNEENYGSVLDYWCFTYRIREMMDLLRIITWCFTCRIWEHWSEENDGYMENCGMLNSQENDKKF